MGFPGGTSGKEPTCQCRRCKRLGFDPWVGKIPHAMGQLSPCNLHQEKPLQREARTLQLGSSPHSSQLENAAKKQRKHN